VVAAGALDRTAYRLQPSTSAVLPGRARLQGIFFTGTRRVEITSGGKTRTETVTGGLMVDEAATVVVVRDTDGTPLPLVDDVARRFSRTRPLGSGPWIARRSATQKPWQGSPQTSSARAS
jgi:hypothetical protein